MTVGERIKNRRKDLGLSAEQVALYTVMKTELSRRWVLIN